MFDAEYEYRIIDRHWATSSIVELVLEPVSDEIRFQAGQYVLLEDVDRRVPIRSYSIANMPRKDGIITLLVTLVPDGPTSTWLVNKVAINQTVFLSGPFGDFVRDKSGQNSVLAIAGGSGWAPIRALAEDALSDGLHQSFTILFSARTERDVMDRGKIEKWENSSELFKFIRTLTRSTGDPPLGRIQKVLPMLFGRLVDTDVFVAGPPGIVAGCTATVRDLGITGGQLFTEEYYSDPVPWE